MDATATAIYDKYLYDRATDRGPWREVNATARELPQLNFAVKIDGQIRAFKFEKPEGVHGFPWYLSEVTESDSYGRNIDDPAEVSRLFSALTWRDSLAGVEAEYGKITGRCGQCNRKLSAEDREHGIGSQCRRFYGCPWNIEYVPLNQA